MQFGVDPISNAWDNLLLTLGGPALDRSGPADGVAEITEKLTPVTIFGGFLGAGKTTLLCQLLQQAPIEIVAIVNDLASVNIDAALVRESNAETIELENGCACCVLGNDLRDTLDALGRRPRPPDAIVIEASGISDPLGIAMTVENVASVTLDGIVTVVDAQTCSARTVDPMTEQLFARQLAAAHLIVLTKTSEDTSSVVELRAKIETAAPGCAVIEADSLFEADDLGVGLLLGAALRGARPTLDFASHSYDGFTVELIDWRQSVCAADFFNLLDELSDAVYRLKGWVCLDEVEPEYSGSSILQKGYDVQATGVHWRVLSREQNDQHSQLVAIGASDDASFLSFVDKLRSLGPRPYGPATLSAR